MEQLDPDGCHESCRGHVPSGNLIRNAPVWRALLLVSHRCQYSLHVLGQNVTEALGGRE